MDINDVIEEQKNEQRDAADGALEEYLENFAEVDSEASKVLVAKLESDSVYRDKFQSALMQMSLLISAAMAIVNQSENEYAKIQKKLLFDSRSDDEEMKRLRLFYANTITQSEIAMLLDTQEERDTYQKRINSFIVSYKELHQLK